ncbi:(Fe-S)-binding protein [Salinicola rhizosphaerae]|uniref:4Fe-4S ferredoxin n=1 Tax=Salinicola rhizosphaerae TaxID=1443141 RepID=A0ABQ3E9W8_9GAMM|nr:(Fe-S)-binding protein [Salinicola rhizosphaerae]GHB24019.1 4Fe-4S ferredoxin [Salinicola rhizosphaerae]
MLQTLLPILIFTALAVGAIGAARRIRLWRRGRRSPMRWQRLLRMPKRYLNDLHHVVARDKAMAHTHVATAGGFVAAMALAIVVHGFGWHGPILGGLLLAASIVMFVGALAVNRRRLNPPAKLSKGPWQRLSKSLLAYSVGMFLVSLPLVGVAPTTLGGGALVLVLTLLVAWGLLEMIVGMGWGGPMKHAFAGSLHLAFHRRPERFDDQHGEPQSTNPHDVHRGSRSTALFPLDLAAPKLGVEKPSDFQWEQLLGFDACVQCGRCQAVCPAFAAGQPLNPKKLIQDMVVGMAGGTDARYAGSGYPGIDVGKHHGSSASPIVPQLVEAETLWACTTCRACVEECPMMIEHVDAIVDMRRFITLEMGETPEKGAAAIDNLIATDNPGGLDNASRLDWAADLDLDRIKDRPEGVDVLLWLGDGAFDMRNQRTLRALVKILRAGGVDFAVLGEEERDSGDVARRLGDEATFQRLAERNIATLSRYRFRRIVTADPHSFHVIGREYPAFGGTFEILHHSTFMAELFEAGRLSVGVNPHSETVTYHDPCYLGRYNGEFAAPRQLLAALGLEVAEMARSGYRSRCCGGGGGAALSDVPGKARIPDMRMEDVRETGATTVAVACPQCTAMLEGVVEPRPQIRDLAELVAEALIEPGFDEVVATAPTPARAKVQPDEEIPA